MVRPTMNARIFPDADDLDPALARERARERRTQRRTQRHDHHASDDSGLQSNAVRKTWHESQDYFYRLCLGWVRGVVHDAEDVMGRGWVKILELDAGTAQKIRNPKPWISRTLRNMCIDNCRSRARAKRIENQEVGIPVPAPSPSPDTDLSRKQLAEAIASAMTRLPPSLREVVMLRLIEEQSYADIGDTLDISVLNARKRLQQARALLRPELEQFRDARGLSTKLH